MNPAPAPALPESAARPGERLFWLLHTAGWLAYALYSLLAALGHGKSFDYWKVCAASTIAGFITTALLRYPLRYLMRFAVPVFILGSILPVLLCALIVSQAYVFTLLEWGCNECRPSGPLGYIAYMGSFTYVIVTWSVLYFGIKTHLQLQWRTRESLQAHAMAHQAQLKMLRYQLNPHFLFNTLNAISTLILDRDNQTANRMVTGLSAFLRYSLDADPVQRVTLKQELEAIHLYLGIEKLRFAERLNLSSNIEPAVYSAQLPSLLLQPLIENAIKYAVAKRVAGGRIEIIARRDGDDLEIIVRDDGPGFANPGAELPGGNGVGLRNTRDRMRVLYGERQSFVMRNHASGGAEIVLRLPYEPFGARRD